MHSFLRYVNLEIALVPANKTTWASLDLSSHLNIAHVDKGYRGLMTRLWTPV